MALSVFVVIVSSITTFYFTIYTSPNLLCILSKGFKEPSTAHYFIIERIYNLQKSKKVAGQLIDKMSRDINPSVNDCYARILGVIGETKSLTAMENIYLKYHNNEDYQKTLDYIILSIGLLGDKSAIPFLEKIMNENKKNKSLILGSTISSALYLLTGQTDYSYTNIFGNRQTIIITKNLKEARKIIVKSKNRMRTLSEMITLDSLFRAPESD